MQAEPIATDLAARRREESQARYAQGAHLTDDRMLPTAAVCAWLNIGRETLRRWRIEHNFPAGVSAVNGGALRFSEAAIRDWLATRASKAAA